MPTSIDYQDVQSLVFSAHGKLKRSLGLLLEVRDAASARESLQELTRNCVDFGIPEKGRVMSTQVFLTYGGLKALGVPEKERGALSREFQQGIAAAHRSRSLGDVGGNDPSRWRWSDRSTHAMVVLYGESLAQLRKESEKLIETLGGWKAHGEISMRLTPREPFGFRDGLSNPRIDDREYGKGGVDTIPAGDAIIGQRNANGATPEASPISRNGSYLVVRQLKQDVDGFWDFWRKAAQGDEERAVWYASKAVGRWPNGLLVSGRDAMPEPQLDAKAHDMLKKPFSFREDVFGDGCPLGAHIRRANPRDGDGENAEESAKVTSLHRLIRRGRVFGKVPDRRLYPENIRNAIEEIQRGEEDGAEDSTGLLFIALCTDIARQFEFMQETWLNNPKHVCPFSEADPIAASFGGKENAKTFTIPKKTMRERLEGIQSFVSVLGGGYFLLPGRKALERIAKMD